MTFDQSLAKLAARIALKAADADTNFQESVDAFKALITYYSALKKTKATADDQSGEPNFATSRTLWRSTMAPKFEVVQDDEPETSSAEATATSLLLLSLKSLSQKALVAAAAMFSLLTVISVFWLALTVMGSPNGYQLAGLGGYACFILAINWIVRRK